MTTISAETLAFLETVDTPTICNALEIVAPVAAYNAAGAASGCPGSSGGAVICGWKEMGRCWVPVPGSSGSSAS